VGNTDRERRWRAGLAARMAGPGGSYNLGNAFGLLSGIAVQVILVADGVPRMGSSALAAYDFLAGSPSAIALTLAMVIFFWSGEYYYRAWENGFPPDARATGLGDLPSGYGAVVLGLGC
jgi:hypothetical protein